MDRGYTVGKKDWANEGIAPLDQASGPDGVKKLPLSLDDPIERLQPTSLVASRLRHYGTKTIGDLLRLSSKVPRVNVADPALRGIHTLIEQVRKVLEIGNARKTNREAASLDRAFIEDSWSGPSGSTIVIDEETLDDHCQGASKVEASQGEPELQESSQPVLQSPGFVNVTLGAPGSLADPVEALDPPAWIMRRLKQLSVDTVGDLLRLPLSALSTTLGRGVRPIEGLIKKAQMLYLLKGQEGTENVSQLANNDFVPESGSKSLSAHTAPAFMEASRSRITEEATSHLLPQPNEMIAILDGPWNQILTLPNYVANGLDKAGLKTLREVIIASRGSKLLAVRGLGAFGTHSLCSLRQEVARLKPQLLSLCLTPSLAMNSVISECHIECSSTCVKEPLLSDDSIENLNPPSLIKGLLARLGVNTVGDLLDLSPEILKTIPGVGIKKIREIETLIKRVQNTITIGNGKAVTLASDSPEPLVEEAVSLPERPAKIATTLERPWDEFLTLSVRVANGLHRANIKTLREAIVASKDDQLLKLKNFGKRSLNDLRQALDELDFRLRATDSQQEKELKFFIEKFVSREDQESLNCEALRVLRQRCESLGIAQQPCSVLRRRFSAQPSIITPVLDSIELEYGSQTLDSLLELLPIMDPRNWTTE